MTCIYIDTGTEEFTIFSDINPVNCTFHTILFVQRFQYFTKTIYLITVHYSLSLKKQEYKNDFNLNDS